MIFLKLQVFLKSLWFHIARGLPKCTKTEILQRYNICTNCEHFDQNKSQCGICGCNVSQKPQFLNKLAWADQQCPINKWSAIQR